MPKSVVFNLLYQIRIRSDIQLHLANLIRGIFIKAIFEIKTNFFKPASKYDSFPFFNFSLIYILWFS